MVDLLNSIACLTCRNKKIKCDRVLPACSQCASSSIDCTYPQGNKRGIPTGYISSLEKRLLQTETALFEVLCHVHGINSEQYPRPTSQAPNKSQSLATDQNRSERLSEWEQYPLATEEQRSTWLYARMADFGSTTATAWQPLGQLREQPVMYSTQQMSSPRTDGSTWSSPVQLINDSIEEHTINTSHSYTEATAGTVHPDGEAKRLSDRNSKRYF